MTQKEQFANAAAAIVAQYQKESAAAIALHKKYVERYEAAKDAAEAIKLEWDQAKRQAKADRLALMNSDNPNDRAKVDEVRKAFYQGPDTDYLKRYTAAEDAVKDAFTVANLAALPVVHMQAIARLKIYRVFFAVYTSIPELKKGSARLATIEEYTNQIARTDYHNHITLTGAQTYCSPYNGYGTIKPNEIQGLINLQEDNLANDLKSESDILSRAELIRDAYQKMLAMKANYEKNASALYGLMKGLWDRSETRENLQKIRVEWR